ALNNLTTKMLASTVQFSNNHPQTHPHDPPDQAANQRPPAVCDPGRPGNQDNTHPTTSSACSLRTQQCTKHPHQPRHNFSTTKLPPAQYSVTSTQDSGMHLLVAPLR